MVYLRIAISVATILGFWLPVSTQAQTVWDRVDSTVGLRYWAFGCADSMVCAGGGNLLSSGASVRATTDGGATWNTVLSIPQYSEAVRTPRSIACAPNGVWYVGTDSGKIEKTTDYGTTWEQIVFDSDRGVGHISALDASTLVISQYPNLIRLSEDGGLGWRTAPVPASVASMSVRDLQYIDQKTIIAIMGVGEQSAMMISTDTGRSFEVRTSHRNAADIHFIDSLLGWQVGAVPTSGDEARDLIRRTTDGGRTWEVQLDSPQRWRYGLSSISFANRHNGIAVGMGGKTLITTNGGQEWTQKRELPDDYVFRDLVEVAYPSPGVAFAVTPFGAVYRLRRTSSTVQETLSFQDREITLQSVGSTLWLSIPKGVNGPLTVRVFAVNGVLLYSRPVIATSEHRLYVDLPGNNRVVIVQLLVPGGRTERVVMIPFN